MIRLLLLILFFINFPSVAAQIGDAENLDDAFEVVDLSYPDYRTYWGVFYVASGLYGGIWGFKEFFAADGTAPALAGFALTFTTWTTLFDGFRLLKGLSEPEVVAGRYERYAPGAAREYGGVISKEEFGRTRLATLSEEAYRGRMWRAVSHFVAAGALFYFYSVGSEKGSYFLLGPAVAFAGAALWRLFQDSPEEQADAIAKKRVTWRVLPLPGSIFLAATF